MHHEVEVPQTVQALVFRAAVRIRHSGRNLGRMEAAFDDAGAMVNAALAVRKDKPKLSVRASEAMLAQHRDQHWRQRHGTLPRL